MIIIKKNYTRTKKRIEVRVPDKNEHLILDTLYKEYMLNGNIIPRHIAWIKYKDIVSA